MKTNKKTMTRSQLSVVVLSAGEKRVNYGKKIRALHPSTSKLKKLIRKPKMNSLALTSAMKAFRGYVNWLNAMSYGVSSAALTNILTGAGKVDVNVLLLVLTTLVITITGLVKVYMDVQFKDSG